MLERSCPSDLEVQGDQIVMTNPQRRAFNDKVIINSIHGVFRLDEGLPSESQSEKLIEMGGFNTAFDLC